MTNGAFELGRGERLRRVASTALSLLGVVACVGCNSLDEPIPEDQDGFRLVIPTDLRPAVSAERKPAAVTGGTVLVTRDGQRAVVSDPDRDRILVVDIGAVPGVIGTIPLQPGDEPGRLVEDQIGRIHVALRRGGAVVSIDAGSMTVIDRRAVCGAPRGISLTGPNQLAVACADGKLVSMAASGGAPFRTLALPPDLRDVVVTSTGELVVSRFKSAEMLRLDAQGVVTRRDWPGRVMGTRQVPVPREQAEFGPSSVPQVDPFLPLVAWRSLSGNDGSVVVVHQRAVDAEVVLVPPSQGASSYGGGEGPGCAGISQNALTVIGPTGGARAVTFTGAPLPVDAALIDGGRAIVVAHAGVRDPKAPRPFVVFDGDGPSGVAGPVDGEQSSLSIIDVPPPPPEPGDGQGQGGGSTEGDPGCTFAQRVRFAQPAVAVASIPTFSRGIVVQTRQPASLFIFDDVYNEPRSVALDEGTPADTGFELFHRDSGGGIACASCHPEGAEDGNVWRFSDTGARRTQSLQADIAATAPFHWDGKLASIGSIMSQVFVDRMGGVHQSGARLGALSGWLFAQEAPAPIRPGDDPAVERGRSLFESTGCTDCHSGEHFTNNRSANVGTGESLQVPSLVGIGYRAPFMHTGCAKTLADRFDPACGGGELHGRIRGGLAGEDLTDMVAYLESL